MVKLTQSLRKVSGVLPVTSSHCALVVPPGHTIRLGGLEPYRPDLPYRTDLPARANMPVRADLPARADLPDRHDPGQLVGPIRRNTAVYGNDVSLLSLLRQSHEKKLLWISFSIQFHVKEKKSKNIFCVLLKKLIFSFHKRSRDTINWTPQKFSDKNQRG